MASDNTMDKLQQASNARSRRAQQERAAEGKSYTGTTSGDYVTKKKESLANYRSGSEGQTSSKKSSSISSKKSSSNNSNQQQKRANFNIESTNVADRYKDKTGDENANEQVEAFFEEYAPQISVEQASINSPLTSIASRIEALRRFANEENGNDINNQSNDSNTWFGKSPVDEADAAADANGMASKGNSEISEVVAPDNIAETRSFLDVYNDYVNKTDDFGTRYSDPYQFMINGTSDDWYNFVLDEAVRPYYSVYEDQFGSFDDVANFNNYYNDSKQYTYDDAILNGDLADRIIGNDSSIFDALQYGFIDDSPYNELLGMNPDGTFFSWSDIENPVEGSRAYQLIADGDTRTLRKEMMDYALGAALLQSVGDLTQRGFDSDEIGRLFALDSLEYGVQGDDVQMRDNPEYALAFNPYDLYGDAWKNYGVTIEGMPDLYSFRYPEYGVREKR